MLKVLFAFALVGSFAAAQKPVADKVEKIFEVVGFSPELNVYFAQNFKIPDDEKCIGYILDLDKKIKFIMPPAVGISRALGLIGEDEETRSCQLREFASQLEIKLATIKNYSPEQKKQVQEYEKMDWSKPLEGFKDMRIASLGQFLRQQRPKWHPEMASKLYELGATEVEDKSFVDAYTALIIATELKPNFITHNGVKQSDEAMKFALKGIQTRQTDDKGYGQAIFALEDAVRLNPKNVKAWLALAKENQGGFPRAVSMVNRALKIDPVQTTRVFREDPGFWELRCSSQAESARKTLPSDLLVDLNCKALK